MITMNKDNDSIVTRLLHSLTSRSFYDRYKDRLNSFYVSSKSGLYKSSDSIFVDNMEDLYNIICDRYVTSDKCSIPSRIENVSKEDLILLWEAQNPVATRARTEVTRSNIDAIYSSLIIPLDIADSLIDNLYGRWIGYQVASKGLSITDNRVKDVKLSLEEVENFISGCKLKLTLGDDSIDKDDDDIYTTKDISSLLSSTSNESRWRFNIRTLYSRIYGIGPGEFGICFALPETGKSTFLVSLCTSPSGFCDQGAKVLYLGNEEDTKRTMLRAIMAYTGKTRDQILDSIEESTHSFNRIRNKYYVKDVQEWSLDDIEALIKKCSPDIVCLDQADKVKIKGTFNASHERLRELYRSLRELAKRRNVALLGVSQASNEARDKTRLSAFDMEGSKIGKAAETDLIIGIGLINQPSTGATEMERVGGGSESECQTSSRIRYLTVSKNKLNGWHGTIITKIVPEVCRFIE